MRIENRRQRDSHLDNGSVLSAALGLEGFALASLTDSVNISLQLVAPVERNQHCGVASDDLGRSVAVEFLRGRVPTGHGQVDRLAIDGIARASDDRCEQRALLL